MHKCPHINVLNIETEPRMGDRWVTRSVNGNGILVLAIMKKLKSGCHIVNINNTEKFQTSDSPQCLGLQFSKCQWKQNISVSYYGKIEKWPPYCKYKS